MHGEGTMALPRKNAESKPLVSVIMNCFNGDRYLREAIDSVMAQSYGNWEIVFWDNRSTDKSVSIVRGYEDPRLNYCLAPEHTTLGQARNLALEHARGELIAFLDCDDRWLEAKLEQQVRLFAADPKLDFVYGNCFFINEEGKRRELAYRKPQPRGDVFRSFLRYYPVNLQTVMLRKSSLARLSHVFDPELEMSEEYDLFMRFLFDGKADYLDTPIAEYRIHNAMSSIQKIERYPLENKYILNKLGKTIQHFEDEYSDELKDLRAKIAYWHATAEMRKGSRQRARNYLAPYKWHSSVFFALHFLTFCPRSLWVFLQENRRKFQSY